MVVAYFSLYVHWYGSTFLNRQKATKQDYTVHIKHCTIHDE